MDALNAGMGVISPGSVSRDLEVVEAVGTEELVILVVEGDMMEEPIIMDVLNVVRAATCLENVHREVEEVEEVVTTVGRVDICPGNVRRKEIKLLDIGVEVE